MYFSTSHLAAEHMPHANDNLTKVNVYKKSCLAYRPLPEQAPRSSAHEGNSTGDESEEDPKKTVNDKGKTAVGPSARKRGKTRRGVISVQLRARPKTRLVNNNIYLTKAHNYLYCTIHWQKVIV